MVEPKTLQSIGPQVGPPWWNFIRQLVIFALGIGCIVYALVTPGHDIPFIVAGLVLIGFVPIDGFIVKQADNGRNESHE